MKTKIGKLELFYTLKSDVVSKYSLILFWDKTLIFVLMLIPISLDYIELQKQIWKYIYISWKGKCFKI